MFSTTEPLHNILEATQINEQLEMCNIEQIPEWAGYSYSPNITLAEEGTAIASRYTEIRQRSNSLEAANPKSQCGPSIGRLPSLNLRNPRAPVHRFGYRVPVVDDEPSIRETVASDSRKRGLRSSHRLRTGSKHYRCFAGPCPISSFPICTCLECRDSTFLQSC